MAAQDETSPLSPLAKFHNSQHVHLTPAGSVYSLFTFVQPLEQATKGRYCSWLTAFCFWLVVLNYIMQFGMMRIVQEEVYAEHVGWIEKTVKLKKQAWYLLRDEPSDVLGSEAVVDLVPPGALSSGIREERCLTGHTLCYFVKGNITCAPPSVRVLEKFSLLDIDQDGVWTKEEALRPNVRRWFKCHFRTDTAILFDFIQRSLVNDPHLKKKGLLHPNVTAGTGIHKSYHDWLKAEPILCMYGDEDMCGNLLARGVFDGALEKGTWGDVRDARSARRYCRHLLRPGGKCERMLPGTYTVWRAENKEQCGKKDYRSFVYENPHDPNDHPVSVLIVQHENQQEYAKTQTADFQLFLTILLLSYFATMYQEFKAILVSFLFCLQFPAADDGSNQIRVKQDAESAVDCDHCALVSITKTHRFFVFAITLFRFILCLALLWTGTIFLLSDTSYFNLIFDALSLVFIMQVDELLYETMLRTKTQNLLEKVDEVQLDLPTWFPKRRSQLDMLLSMLIVVVAYLFVREYVVVELLPVGQALACGCAVSGDTCVEANTFNSDWWYRHWTVDVPQAERTMAAIQH